VKLDPRKLLKLENQGPQGSCRGHSGSTNTEWLVALATNGKTLIQLSRAMMYYETQRIDGIRGDNGSTIMGGVKLLLETGICIEDLWKYTANKYNPARPADWQAVLESAKKYRVKSARRCRSYDELRIHLGSGQGGADFGIPWSDAYKRPIVERFTGGGGGHAIAVLCLSERLDTKGRPYVWMFNSWGESSGTHGWSEWSPTFIEGVLRDPASVVVLYSDLAVPQVRKFTLEEWEKVLIC
jgi:Papain family cysteine protease